MPKDQTKNPTDMRFAELEARVRELSERIEALERINAGKPAHDRVVSLDALMTKLEQVGIGGKAA